MACWKVTENLDHAFPFCHDYLCCLFLMLLKMSGNPSLMCQSYWWVRKFSRSLCYDTIMHGFYWYCYYDRCVLLGDSAHATLPYVGQGANQALEDAYVLADCLDACQYRYTPAFQAYYDRRAKRTKRFVDLSTTLGRIYHVENFFLSWVSRSIVFLKKKKKRVLMRLHQQEKRVLH